MKLAILQPTFIPNMHDLAIILQSDLLVLDDMEVWSRKGRVHRAKIRTPEGTQYINVPVFTKDRSKAIHKVGIDHTEKWIEPLLRSLEYNYRNSVYYDFYEPEIRSDFESAVKFNSLLDFNLYLRERIFRFLELEKLPLTLLASNLNVYHHDPDQLAENLKADQYFQEPDSRHYQRQGKNRKKLEFDHPEYRQHFDGFEPDCCLLDLLFQYGPESFRVIDDL